MKKILCVCLMLAALAFGREVREGELEPKDRLLYYKGETTPFTGTVKETFPDGKKQQDIRVKDGLIESFEAWYEDGNPYFSGKCVGQELTGDVRTYHPDGGNRGTVTFKIIQSGGDKSAQQALMSLTDATINPWTLLSEYAQSGEMIVHYVENLPGDTNRELVNFDLTYKEGFLEGKGKGVVPDADTGDIEYRFRTGDFRKLDVEKLVKLYEPLSDANKVKEPEQMLLRLRMVDFNAIAQEWAKLENVDFEMDMKNFQGSGSMRMDAHGNLRGFDLDLNVITGDGGPFVLKAHISDVMDVDVNEIMAVAGSPDKLATVAVMLKEAAKIGKLSYYIDMTQQGIRFEVTLTLEKGRLGALLRRLTSDGKPRVELTAVIPDIARINLPAINAQNPPAALKALGVSGTYAEFDENGAVKGQGEWNPDNFLLIMGKLAQYLQ